MEERRTDMRQLMQAVEEQNTILAQQNLLLKQICAFITPVSAFFTAFKTFVTFVAWILGTIAACVAAWHGFVAWVKTH